LSQQQPFLLVFAGPNGSGKSTLTDYLMEAGVDFGEYINPDDRRDRCLSSRLSFSFACWLSGEFVAAQSDERLAAGCRSNWKRQGI
jgi:energy-coupling factor transporter ATP-binding protein EcfA2